LNILHKNKEGYTMHEAIDNNNNDSPDNKFQCHHIFPDGFRCGSPRMRDEQFCYFHHDSRRPVVRPEKRIARRSTFSLFTPTSHDSIQESLGDLLIRIAANDIDARRAGLLLYGLQLASTNLRIAHRAQQTQNPPDPEKS
jgi:hypothetical protein